MFAARADIPWWPWGGFSAPRATIPGPDRACWAYRIRLIALFSVCG